MIKSELRCHRLNQIEIGLLIVETRVQDGSMSDPLGAIKSTWYEEQMLHSMPSRAT